MTTHHHDHTTRCWWNHDHARWICRPGSTSLPAADATATHGSKMLPADH